MARESVPSSTRTHPLRLVHVVPHLDGGGLESLVGALIAGCVHGGIEVSVVTLDGQLGRIGQQVRPLVKSFSALRPLPIASMIFPLSIVRALRATEADVAHIHSGCWFKGALAARIAGVERVVFTEHGREHRDPLILRLLDRIASTWTDVVVTVSERLASYMSKRIGISPRKIRTIENGIDAERFSPGPADPELRSALGLPPDAIVVGSIGRLEPVKAYDRLIDALALVDRTKTPVHLVLCGDGSERARLQARGVSSGVPVHFTGWVQDTERYYRTFDIFALTSVSEGLSVSLLEAMATGAAPVVTDVGASRHVLGPELSSQVSASEDPADIAKCISQALLPHERRRAGSLARLRVLNQFDQASMLRKYITIYNGDQP